MRTILVTGGCGFLGSHLVQRLQENKDNEIVVIDNLITGSEENIKHFNNRVRLFIDPSKDSVEDICKDCYYVGVDEIYHLASIASPPIYQQFPLQTAKANSVGTLNMLEIATCTKAKMVYASTSEVYGDPLEHPQKEDYYGNVNCIGPRSCYDESKRFGETLCYIYKDIVDVKIARIFNTYGPRMLPEDGRVVTNFIHQIINNKPLTFYGDGTQTRSFMYVDDCVDGLITLMEKGKTGEAYNLGNPEEISMLTLGNVLVRLFEKDPATYPAINKRLPKDDPKTRCPDIKKIMKLDWSPNVSLGIGLRKMINYIKEER